MIKTPYCSGICIDQTAMKRDAYTLMALACSRKSVMCNSQTEHMRDAFDFNLCLELMVNTAIKARLVFENNQTNMDLPNPKIAKKISSSGSSKSKSRESLKQTCNLIGHHVGCWFKPISDACDGTIVVIALPPLRDATDQRHRLYEICLSEFALAAYEAMDQCEDCARTIFTIDVDPNTGLPELCDETGLPKHLEHEQSELFYITPN